jgi:hypothetical protein
MVIMGAPKHALTTDRTKWAALTPPRRKAIYGIVAALLAVGMAYGLVTPEQSTHWLDVADKALGLIALVLAASHTGGVYEAPIYGERDLEEPGK